MEPEHSTEQLELLPVDDSTALPSVEKVEIDALAAGWFLFHFGRANRKNRATHKIKTLLPNNQFKVVKIQVESSHTRLNKKTGKEENVGLPGAFGQDVYLSLIDKLITNVRESGWEPNKSELSGKVLKKIPSLPTEATELYFRNKDIANNLRMEEKNSRITDALNHLHKTHITIEGTIYANGKTETIKHQAYYIPSLTVGKHLRGGMKQNEWQRVSFDDYIVSQILSGYVAQLDKKKLVALPSGAPRKLYSLLSAKKAAMPSSKEVLISSDELINILQLTVGSYKKLAKKYFSELQNTGVIEDFHIKTVLGEEVVVFFLRDDELFLTGGPEGKIRTYFEGLRQLSKMDSSLESALGEVNFRAEDLIELARKLKAVDETVFEFRGKRKSVLRAVLQFDQLLWTFQNEPKSKKFQMERLLYSLLKSNKPVNVFPKYVPTWERLNRTKTDLAYQREVAARERYEKQTREAIEFQANIITGEISDCMDSDFKMALEKFKKQLKSSVGMSFSEELYIKALVQKCIENGVDTSDSKEIVKFVNESGDH